MLVRHRCSENGGSYRSKCEYGDCDKVWPNLEFAVVSKFEDFIERWDIVIVTVCWSQSSIFTRLLFNLTGTPI